MLGLPLTGLLILGIDGDHHFNTLPYYTEEGTLDEWTEQAQRIEPFSLINQNGESFDSEKLNGKVWIAAFSLPMRRTLPSLPSNCSGQIFDTETKVIS